MKIKFCLFIFVMQVLSLLCCDFSLAFKSPYDWAFIQLDYARQKKIMNLNRFTEKIHDLGDKVAKDDKVAAFFEINRQYYLSSKSMEVPSSLTDSIEEMRIHFNDYYLRNYFTFYNMLFVDIDGTMFYSLRKELNFNINLLKNKKSIGLLSEVMTSKPLKEIFIDFYEYPPSAEPASFLVEPIIKNGTHVGWVILQCAINKLNSIFASTDNLGQTGETFLVNSDGLMLTESYFKGYSTILNQHLDNRTINAKFNEKSGHRIVVDYRGFTALSSFEVFNFLNTKWLVVAKIDKDEITTDHYRRHNKYYSNKIIAYLKKIQKPSSVNFESSIKKSVIRVDMDEFMKAEQEEFLETWGVSTCTALIASLPKKFAYLAHISSKDRIYNGHETDLLSQITKKIISFDIYHSERRSISFTIVSPHLNTLARIVNKLIDSGFLLSQIQVAFNQNARSASILYNYMENYLVINWIPHHGERNITYNIQDTINLGTAIEKIMIKEK